MTLAPWEIIVIGLVLIYLLHRLVRNSLWDEKKELTRFQEISESGPFHHSARHGFVPLAIGLLLMTVWSGITLSWFWLVFGIFLIVIGLVPYVGLILNRITRESDFEWEPPNDSEIRIKVKRRKLSAIFFLLVIGAWSYSWLQKVI